MSSLIELRKQELTTQIDKMISVVQFFIDNRKSDENAPSISQYLDLNGIELYKIQYTLRSIKNKFNPKSDSFETFEKCINSLKELQKEIRAIQARGEAELKRQRRNSAAKDKAEIFAATGALLGGVIMGFSGCMSCSGQHYEVGEVPITAFNLITGLLIGAIGGAIIGAIIGAMIGVSSSD